MANVRKTHKTYIKSLILLSENRIFIAYKKYMSVTHFLYGNRGFIVQIVQTVIRLLAECLKQYKMQLKRLGILGIIWTEELYFGGQLSGKVV